MTDSRVPLKNPWLAALLAFLLPGAGHWYQGRRFKATIYFGCIVTMFVWGLIIGHGQPVYSQLVARTGPDSPQLEVRSPPTKFAFGYAAQFFVGLPAVPALIQEMRFRRDDPSVTFLDHEISSAFTGVLVEETPRGEKRVPLVGQLQLSPTKEEGSRTVRGTLEVTGDPSGPRTLNLGGNIRIGRRVFGAAARELTCSVLTEGGEFQGQRIEGTVDRGFLNWFQAPPDTGELDRLHGSLSRQYDVACVFTWIAGLLNLMAIWDAAQGPAYGYGDEKSEDDGEPVGGGPTPPPTSNPDGASEG